TGTASVSILAIAPLVPMVKRSIGSLSCGDTIRRPLPSTVIETHEPSPGWELRSNFTLKPGRTLGDSAEAACPDFRAIEFCAWADIRAATSQNETIHKPDRRVIIGCIAVRRFMMKSLQTMSAGQGVFSDDKPSGPIHDGARVRSCRS